MDRKSKDSRLYWGGIVLIFIILIFIFWPLALLLACLLIAWAVFQARGEFSKPSIETMEFPIQQLNPSAPDRTIPTNVKLYVWRRDGGRCVECGSNEKLEYDHIIPVSKGGSNTERNVQLLCEHCNRMKHAKIM
jgi:Restriction endonuclease